MKQRTQTLRLVTYNMQVGIESRRYRHYLTNSWKHVLPFRGRGRTLARVAHELAEYDVVALQEIDGGSARTHFVNQAEYLAREGGFPVWRHQVNREIGQIARHSNGLLMRAAPASLSEHRLPGLRGRGALLARYDTEGGSLGIVVVHLALGRLSRMHQLRYLAKLVLTLDAAVLLGDFNCSAESPEFRALLRATGLRLASRSLPTFPSWKPVRALDHILVGGNIDVARVWVPEWSYSDHRPVAACVETPAIVRHTSRAAGAHLTAGAPSAAPAA